MPGAPRGITVFTLGEIRDEAFAALRAHFAAVEVLAIDLAAGASLAASQATLRADVNRASNDWVLILREGERVTAGAAAEMGTSITDPPTAWGFRLRIVPTCGGAPLLLDRNLSRIEDRGLRIEHPEGPQSAIRDPRSAIAAGEIRFFHRRHVRFDMRGRGEMNVEGTVLRLREPLERELFPSHEAHREWLASNGVPHSALRRILLFVKRAAGARALRSRPTLRWIWDEAGWDRGA